MAAGVQVVVDCADPSRLARFWAEALGYRMEPPPDGFATWQDFLQEAGVPEAEWNSASAVVDPDGIGPRVFFQRVPEPKAVKNRVHLDVNVGGGRGTPEEERRTNIAAAVERLETAGARRLREMEQRSDYWVVMADPEGNEFCLQ